MHKDKDQAPVVQRLDSNIHWMNHYPLDKSMALIAFISGFST